MMVNEKSATADKVQKAGDWTLRIFFISKGSRNEGIDGQLYYRDEPVSPEFVGQIITTDLGQLKFYQHSKLRKMPYEFTGWNFADSNLIKNSWESE